MDKDVLQVRLKQYAINIAHFADELPYKSGFKTLKIRLFVVDLLAQQITGLPAVPSPLQISLIKWAPSKKSWMKRCSGLSLRMNYPKIGHHVPLLCGKKETN